LKRQQLSKKTQIIIIIIIIVIVMSLCDFTGLRRVHLVKT